RPAHLACAVAAHAARLGGVRGVQRGLTLERLLLAAGRHPHHAHVHAAGGHRLLRQRRRRGELGGHHGRGGDRHHATRTLLPSGAAPVRGLAGAVGGEGVSALPDGAGPGPTATLAALRGLLPSLTEAEASVARTVLRDPSGSAKAPIGHLASSAGVSTATVVRMARALGFTGYRDFRTALIAD